MEGERWQRVRTYIASAKVHVARRLQFSITPTLGPHRYVVVVVIIVPFANIVHLGQAVTRKVEGALGVLLAIMLGVEINRALEVDCGTNTYS
jgi:hypothetical protein